MKNFIISQVNAEKLMNFITKDHQDLLECIGILQSMTPVPEEDKKEAEKKKPDTK